MNKIEKTLSVVSITALTLYYLLLNLEGGISDYSIWLIVCSPTAALILNLLFLRSLKFSIIELMTLLFSLVWITEIFKIFHLPAADILAIFSYLLYFPVLAITFLTIGFKRPKDTKIYLIVVGLLLMVQFLIPVLLESWNQNFPRMIVNYALAAATFTAIIKYPSRKLFEKRLMMLLFIYSAQSIIHSIFT